MYTFMYVEARVQVSSLIILHFIFLRQYFSLDLELTVWARLAGQ